MPGIVRIVRFVPSRLPDRSREGTKRDKDGESVMTIRKTGAVTGRILGVENADPEQEPAVAEGQEPDEGLLVDRPLQKNPAPAEDDD
jgi:hypothetical protein